jgi:hypothetical protein
MSLISQLIEDSNRLANEPYYVDIYSGYMANVQLYTMKTEISSLLPEEANKSVFLIKSTIMEKIPLTLPDILHNEDELMNPHSIDQKAIDLEFDIDRVTDEKKSMMRKKGKDSAYKVDELKRIAMGLGINPSQGKMALINAIRDKYLNK